MLACGPFSWTPPELVELLCHRGCSDIIIVEDGAQRLETYLLVVSIDNNSIDSRSSVYSIQDFSRHHHQSLKCLFNRGSRSSVYAIQDFSRHHHQSLKCLFNRGSHSSVHAIQDFSTSLEDLQRTDA